MSTDNDKYDLLRRYIEEHCGIHIGGDKDYLIESRLASLVAKMGCKGFEDLYHRTRNDSTGELRDKIVDAMTTNETLWFRDSHVWETIENVLLPALTDKILSGRKLRARIWCAGCSTGQEAYSLAMCADRAATRLGVKGLRMEHFDIVATDISESALRIAEAGRYDRLAMSRGMRDGYKTRYFIADGAVWVIRDELKRLVRFERFNLLEDFSPMGFFDVVLLRNVAIYFSDRYKQDLFDRVSRTLYPGGVVLLGASESLVGYKMDLERREDGPVVYYAAPDTPGMTEGAGQAQ